MEKERKVTFLNYAESFSFKSDGSGLKYRCSSFNAIVNELRTAGSLLVLACAVLSVFNTGLCLNAVFVLMEEYCHSVSPDKERERKEKKRLRKEAKALSDADTSYANSLDEEDREYETMSVSMSKKKKSLDGSLRGSKQNGDSDDRWREGSYEQHYDDDGYARPTTTRKEHREAELEHERSRSKDREKKKDKERSKRPKKS
ncbi:hypothetical protein MAR_023057 [Mya arenaria]|uniref:Uncharacterized protein n=1 Tax=Mya arenaria TaxID=6604 RepID=A0ABY7DLX4_MYAAR|nr:hypothetical protein MAR_023057 [Mya arenaria]